MLAPQGAVPYILPSSPSLYLPPSPLFSSLLPPSPPFNYMSYVVYRIENEIDIYDIHVPDDARTDSDARTDGRTDKRIGQVVMSLFLQIFLHYPISPLLRWMEWGSYITNTHTHKQIQIYLCYVCSDEVRSKLQIEI